MQITTQKICCTLQSEFCFVCNCDNLDICCKQGCFFCWLLFSVIVVFFLTIFISVIYAFKFVQPLLILLDYEGYERHLFSKNIALQELLLTTAIAFLIGVLPTYFAYRNINASSFEYLFLNMVSVWLTCVSGGQKCMLEHARNVWISNKDR